MRILVFGDTHGDRTSLKKIQQKAEDCDLILCVGDLTVFEANLDEFLSILNTLGKKVFMVHGNHESDDNLLDALKKCKNIIFLHRKIMKFQDHLFLGWGGGGFTEYDAVFNKKMDAFGKVLSGKPSVFMTHAPPYGTKADLVQGSHVGNKSFRKFIEIYQPRLCVCGHIHEAAGRQSMVGKCLVLNPGPEGIVLNIK